jgi:hypothetical protein
MASMLTALLAIALFTPRTAYAYLDPGTGSIVLQAIAGGVAGVLFLLRIYWKKIRSFFGKPPPGNP